MQMLWILKNILKNKIYHVFSVRPYDAMVVHLTPGFLSGDKIICILLQINYSSKFLDFIVSSHRFVGFS